MLLKAKLAQILPIQSGSGKNGEWKKQDVILETEGQFPKNIYISIWGDKINESQLKIGNILKIDFDIESRDYNGKWYTDLKAWKIEVVNTGTEIIPNTTLANDSEFPDSDNDTLPF